VPIYSIISMESDDMKIFKKVLIGIAAVIIVMISFYFLFPGAVIKSATRYARFSAGLERHEVKAANHNWVYLDGGKGETIVFLHGFGFNKDMWGEMLPAFSRTYRVIAPDLPCFGETGFIEGENYTITKEAERFEDFVKQLKLDSFHLVGVSASGGIAGYYAARYPERVKTLTLIGPFGIKSSVKSDFQKAYEKGENPIVFKTPQGFDLMMSYAVNNPQKIPAHFKAYFAKENAKTYDFFIRIFKEEIDKEGWDMLRGHLKNIQSPALIIFGDKDRIFDVSCIDIFKKEIKNVKPYIMKDTGHVTYMDKPEETNRVIKDFIVNSGMK